MNTPHFEISVPPVLQQLRCTLGESPTWSATEQALYWADITGQTVHRYQPNSNAHQSWRVGADVGCVAFTNTGEQGALPTLAVALRHGLFTLNPNNGGLSELGNPHCHPEAHLNTNRYNDGKVAPDGRWWVGSMDDREAKEAVAGLYCIEAKGGKLTHRQAVNQLIVSNGLAWSPDGKTMYHSDSRAATVWAYDYDLASGCISRKRVFINYQEAWGRPDGAAVDAQGCYWSAGVRAGRLNRFSPDGELMSHIPLPLTHPTMPCFGGADLKTIYLTSLRQGVAAEVLAAHPLSGAVIHIEQDVAGLAGNAFALTGA